MADPREAVNHVGIGYVADTYPHDSTIVYDATLAGGAATTMVGKAVTLAANNQIALTADGNMVLGKLIKVEPNGFAVVQIGGQMTLPGGNGATLTAGKKIVGALGASSAKGYIREVATATAAELGVCRGYTIDSSTATDTVVFLEAVGND